VLLCSGTVCVVWFVAPAVGASKLTAINTVPTTTGTNPASFRVALIVMIPSA